WTVTCTGSGDVPGLGTVDVPLGGPLTWTGGTMSGSGNTHILGTLALSGGGNRFLVDRTLTNSRTVAWTDTGGLFINGAGRLINDVDGLIDIQATSASLTTNNGTPSIVNLGNLQNSGGGTAIVTVPLTTSGQVSTNSTGTTDLRAGGTFNAGATFNGTGTTTLSGGAFNVAGTTTALNLSLTSSADLTGPGTLDVPAG